MTPEQKTTQVNQLEFDMSSCMAMMEKMRSAHSEDCDCEEMMSRFATDESAPDEWMQVMSQMMAVHCTPQDGED